MTPVLDIPKTMKGVRVTHPGGPEVLEYRTDLLIPVPGDGEVLVKNDFIGINYVDVYWRIGMMGSAPGGILGREAEGTVISSGDGNVNGLTVGDRVVWLAMGGYAEYTAVPALKAYVIPTGVKPGVAAAALLQGLTALTLTQRIYEVRGGDWALVHAAAGGVGLWLCQLLKMMGARIIGTASTAEKIQLARDNGADFMVNYREEQDLVKKVEEITERQGVGVVYDSIGKDQAANNVRVIADNGTIVTYGAASGIPPPFSASALTAKNVRIVEPGESSLMRYVGTPQEFQKWCAILFELIAEDKVNVRIHDTYPLSEVEKAHKDLEGRKTTGKLLLKP